MDTVAVSDLTQNPLALVSLFVFAAAYGLVVAEERLGLRKSQPVLIAAGIIWTLVAIAYEEAGASEVAEKLFRANLLEFSELFFFVLAAMTYVNTLEDLGTFRTFTARLLTHGFSLRTIFWISGITTFFVSAVADNLTTALFMSTIVLAVAAGQSRFATVGCINVVVAANAGGAFSPFGDITTLMVWQRGMASFFDFFALFVPSLVNWLIPATIMAFAVPKEKPQCSSAPVALNGEAKLVLCLFTLTITLAVTMHQFLHLPPVAGMMMGLGLLKLGSYMYTRNNRKQAGHHRHDTDFSEEANTSEFDVFRTLQRTEWDTLMFFYGIMLCVGGLGALGYLNIISQTVYVNFGPTPANVTVGMLSALIDNIPLMFAVLTMQPDMSLGQWLLVTLTTGTGGSLLSIGSAAGVGVMGMARDRYTFMAHLRWSWAIFIGYAASIATHLLWNAPLFEQLHH